MNTQLQKLFKKYNLKQKDQFEINQIFELLPLDKKQNILDNFDILISRLEYQKKQLELERRILIWDIFEDIKEIYKKYN